MIVLSDYKASNNECVYFKEGMCISNDPPADCNHDDCVNFTPKLEPSSSPLVESCMPIPQPGFGDSVPLFRDLIGRVLGSGVGTGNGIEVSGGIGLKRGKEPSFGQIGHPNIFRGAMEAPRMMGSPILSEPRLMVSPLFNIPTARLLETHTMTPQQRLEDIKKRRRELSLE